MDGYFEKIFFGGSWVRGNPLCHDLDAAICCESSALERLKLFPGIQEVLCKGNTINRIVVDFEGKNIQIDLWRFPMYNWGVGCMFVAGNGKLNVIQRAQAKRQGYQMGFSLRTIADGKPVGEDIPLPTERDVYNFLGWSWLPYEARNK